MSLHVHFAGSIDRALADRFASALVPHLDALADGSHVRGPDGAMWRVREVRRVLALDAAEGSWSEEVHPRDPKGKFAKKGTGNTSYISTLKKHGYEAHPGFPNTEIYHHPSGHHFALYAPSPGGAAKGKADNRIKHLPPHGGKASTVVTKGQLSELLTKLHTPNASPAEIKLQAGGQPHPAPSIHILMTDNGFTAYSGGVPSDTSTLYENKKTGVDVVIDNQDKNGKYPWVVSGNGYSTPVSGEGAFGLSQALLKTKHTGIIDPAVAEPIEEPKSVTAPPWVKNAKVNDYVGAQTIQFATGEMGLIDKKTGKWELYSSGGGTKFGEGTGQTSFNAAFEALHPRGEGGKFAAKPGNIASSENIKKMEDGLVALGFTNDKSSPETMYPDVSMFGHYTGPSGEKIQFNSLGHWSYTSPDKPTDPTYGNGLGNLAEVVEDHLGAAQAKATLEPAVGAPLNLQSLTKIGAQKGSNPGGVYKAEDGTTYYVKQPATSDHARNEILAGALYKLVGANTLTYHPVEDPTTGNLGVATKMENLEADNVSGMTSAQKNEAKRDFAIHAWLANWDAVGLSGDNLGIVGGKPINLDLGGSLLYRAKGAPKGVLFGNDPTEWNTLRDPYKNPQSAALFKDMTPAQLKESADRLKKLTNSSIRDMVLDYGPGDESAKDALADKLIARRDAIIKLGDEAGKQPQVTTPVAPAAPSVPPPKQMYYSSWDDTYKARIAAAPTPTASEAAAVTKYSASAYDPWNKALRSSFGKESGGYPTAALNSWLNKASFPEDATVRRRVSDNFAQHLIEEALSHEEGEGSHTFVDHGFASTDHWSGTLTIEIAVPKGARAAAIGHYSSHPGENEILVQSGSKYRIDSYDPKTKTMKASLIRSGPATTGLWHVKKAVE